METSPNNKQANVEYPQAVAPQDATFIPPMPTPNGPNNIASSQSIPSKLINATRNGNFIRLLVISGIIIIACLAVGYIAVKNNIDKTADDYTTSLKSYLGKVYDEITSAKISPVNAKIPISKLSKPQLPSTFLGISSPKYAAAQATMTIANKKLDAFDTQMNDLIEVYNYQKVRGSTQFIQEDMALKVAGGASLETSTNFLNAIKQVKISMDKFQITNDFKSISENMSKILDDTITAFTTMITASNAGDQIAYKAAYANSITMIEKEIEADKLVIKYYNDLSSKLMGSANELKAYKASIK